MAKKKKAQPATRVDAIVIERVDWWLAELNQYGYASELCDGPHSHRDGVEQALYLIRGLGLERGRKFCCVRVEQTSVEAKPHDTVDVSAPQRGRPKNADD